MIEDDPYSDKAIAAYAEIPEVIEAGNRIRSGNYTDADVAMVIPLVPEFRESMRKAEHAIAEGRTTSLEDVMAKLEEMDEEE